MTFGTCQLSGARVVFASMEILIRTNSCRCSQLLSWLGIAILVGLVGLGYFLNHHPEIEIPHFVGRLASLALCAVLSADHRHTAQAR
jgi:hypothetical protein